MEDLRRYVRQSLAWLHDIEVGVRHDPEDLKHLIEHLPMLRGYHDLGLEPWVRVKRMYEWRHLDGFRPRAENDHDFYFGLGHYLFQFHIGWVKALPRAQAAA